MRRAIHGFTAVQRPRPRQPAALNEPHDAAGPQQQTVSYHGGALLQSVTTRAAFLGAVWNAEPHASLRGRIEAFLAFLVTSDVIDNLAEYGTNGLTVSHGRHAGGVVLAELAVGATLDDSAIQDALTTAIGDGRLAPNDADTLYIAFAPEGTTVTTPSIGNSCERLCGYHGVLANGAAYAVIPYPGCSACQVAGSVFDGLTSVISHEVCEAITNPFDNGWHADDGAEIGDLCALPTWQTRRSGPFVVQKEFSRANGDCR
ncbi:MAG TPA: hypothetical protein VGD01_11625 [Candidatus Elarobacter sp.]|jgi:hypothetical protein